MSEAPLSPAILHLLSFTRSHNLERVARLKATGERFNVFNVLRVGHMEVKTHSPILAELLDPQGTHDQGAVFLDLFLKQSGIAPFAASEATVKLEYHAGERTEKSGGRIDILIQDRSGKMIVIENKIYAGDQENQITRYRALNLKSHVIYLTLDGRGPNGLPEEELKEIHCLSYASDVLAWLKDCRKEAALLPGLRETLTHYIRLIEELTHQSTTGSMNQKLIDEIIYDEESLGAFFAIRDAGTSVEDALVAKLDRQIDEVATSLGLERYKSLGDLRRKWGGFSFATPGLRRCNVHICFEFEAKNFQELYFGFALNDGKAKCPVVAELHSEFSKHWPIEDDSELWPAGAWWIEFRNWGAPEFEAILTGRFAKELKEKLATLKDIADVVCPE